MVTNIRKQGHQALDAIPETHLPTVVKMLQQLVLHGKNPDVEPEELWLLASGELKKMDEEIAQARPIEDWRKFLDEI